MPRKQMIEIDVTWDGYSVMKLEYLVRFMANMSIDNPSLGIKRLTVKEKK